MSACTVRRTALFVIPYVALVSTCACTRLYLYCIALDALVTCRPLHSSTRYVMHSIVCHIICSAIVCMCVTASMLHSVRCITGAVHMHSSTASYACVSDNDYVCECVYVS